jgi:hypothetical protein
MLRELTKHYPESMRRQGLERLMLRKILLLLGLLAVATLLFAQNETLTIKGHSKGGKNPPGGLASLYGDLEGRSVVLECALSHTDCKELPRGHYSLERLIDGEGSYKNCPNVDVYRLGANSSKEEPLGEYCLRHEQN